MKFKELKQDIYFKSPVLLQNVAVTVLGLKLYMERYYGSTKHESTVNSYLQYSTEMFNSLLEYKTINLLKHAITHVPHYKNYAKSINLSCRDISSSMILNEFPVLEKDEIKSNPHSFISENVDSRKMISLHTSGSTGKPLTIITSMDERRMHYAYLSRLRTMHNTKRINKRATLFGRLILAQDTIKPPFWRYDKIQKNLLLSSYHLSDNNLKYYYEKLKSYAPDEIFAYPSSIVRIAKYIVENKLAPLQVKLLMTTAEPLLSFQKSYIKKAFKTNLVNQYGCTEMAFFASTLPNGRFCIHQEHGKCEILSPMGNITDTGTGELLATGLINHTMPLIRYKVGDTVQIQKNEDDSSLEIKNIIGRTDDILLSDTGTPIGRVDPIFKGEFHIANAQVVQNKDLSLDVIVEPSLGFMDFERELLLSEFKKRFGNLPVNIITNQKIKKGVNGKFKAVIREK